MNKINPTISISIQSLLGVKPGDLCPGIKCGGIYDSIDVTWSDTLWQVSAICGSCKESWTIDESTEEDSSAIANAGVSSEDLIKAYSSEYDLSAPVLSPSEPMRWPDNQKQCIIALEESHSAVLLLAREQEKSAKNQILPSEVLHLASLQELPRQKNFTVRTALQRRSNYLLSMRKMMDAIGALLRINAWSRGLEGSDRVKPVSRNGDAYPSNEVLMYFINSHLDKCSDAMGVNWSSVEAFAILRKTVSSKAFAYSLLEAWINKDTLDHESSSSDLGTLRPYRELDVKELSFISIAMISVLHANGIVTNLTSNVKSAVDIIVRDKASETPKG